MFDQLSCCLRSSPGFFRLTELYHYVSCTSACRTLCTLPYTFRHTLSCRMSRTLDPLQVCHYLWCQLYSKTGIWTSAQAVQTLYILVSDQNFSTSPGIVLEETDAELGATEQINADIWQQAVSDSIPDTSTSTRSDSSSEPRPSREFEEMIDRELADPRNADKYFACTDDDFLATVDAKSTPVSRPMIPPKADTIRAPLSPTAANTAHWQSAARCPGAAKPPESSSAATAPVAAALLATETAPVAERTPQLQTAPRRGGSHRSRGGGRSGHKQGHAVTEQSATEGPSAGDGRKRCALSKNQAQVLARKGAARASPRMAAWTQNSDDTDDFML